MSQTLLELNPGVSYGVPFIESGTLATKQVDLTTAQGNTWINPASYRIGGVSGGAGQYVDAVITMRSTGGTKFRVEKWFSFDLAIVDWNYIHFAARIYDGTNRWDFITSLRSESDATKNVEYYNASGAYVNMPTIAVNWIDTVKLWSYMAIDCDIAENKVTRIQWDDIVDETGYDGYKSAIATKAQILFRTRVVPDNGETLHLLLNRLKISQVA